MDDIIWQSENYTVYNFHDQQFNLYVSDFDVDKEVAGAYAESLKQHIAYVREAGHKLGVLPGLLHLHDQSKWSYHEFPAYAKHFKGGGDPENFPKAWLHHLHNNP